MAINRKETKNPVILHKRYVHQRSNTANFDERSGTVWTAPVRLLVHEIRDVDGPSCLNDHRLGAAGPKRRRICRDEFGECRGNASQSDRLQTLAVISVE